MSTLAATGQHRGRYGAVTAAVHLQRPVRDERPFPLARVNGVMDPSQLYEPPYTDFTLTGLDGVFDNATAGKIVTIISQINQNAGGIRASA